MEQIQEFIRNPNNRRLFSRGTRTHVKRTAVLEAVLAGKTVRVTQGVRATRLGRLPRKEDRDITREELIAALHEKERVRPSLTVEQLTMLIRHGCQAFSSPEFAQANSHYSNAGENNGHSKDGSGVEFLSDNPVRSRRGGTQGESGTCDKPLSMSSLPVPRTD